MLRGGCLCGAVRYETTATPDRASNCHCSMCRRSAGAPYLTWIGVARTDFRWLAGVPTIYRSSPGCRRGFCGRCGTHLTFEDDGERIYLTVCSLDDPEAAAPTHNIHAATKLSWVGPDGLKSYPVDRTED
jgi:hypothetical protein